MVSTLRNFLVFVTILVTFPVLGLNISDDYSPKNKKMSVRTSTKYIVLHTTEAGDVSSLNSVKRYASCNYLVLSDGRVKRIVDKDRVSNHAGRSVWNGLHNIGLYSIGIEVVGYHDKLPNGKQLEAIQELLRTLMATYGIPHNNVVTHSMIAYGVPNRYHKHNHRGRKRCGMLFNQDDVRNSIGLTSKQTYDPDVNSKRLVQADPDLHKCLYGDESLACKPTGNTVTKDVSVWMIAREAYDQSSTVYVFPNGQVFRGDQITNWHMIPLGTKVSLGAEVETNPEEFEGLQSLNGKSAWSIARSEYNSSSTIYILPDGRVRTGNELTEYELSHLPNGTNVLVGYVYGGKISPDRTAYRIAGQRWNHPSTIYYSKGGVVRGDELDESQLQHDSIIMFRR